MGLASGCCRPYIEMKEKTRDFAVRPITKSFCRCGMGLIRGMSIIGMERRHDAFAAAVLFVDPLRKRMMTKGPITDLRIVGIAEGVSFLVLLFIAMPLKYLAGLPIAVQIVGSLHGFLFLLYVAAAVRAAISRRWSIVKFALVFVAALFPFGTFLLDRKLREEALAASSGAESSRAVDAPLDSAL